MKKKIFILAALIMLVSIMAQGTLAYFNAQERSYNVITTSDVQVEIIEKTRDQSGKLIDFPEAGVIGVMPGIDVTKQVSVKNIGGGDAWVRAKVTVVVKDALGNEKDLTFGPGDKDVLSYPIQAGWSDGGDGYYYYDRSLADGETTALLMDLVTFHPELGNDYQNCKAEITVSVQAVQTANNGSSVREAKGWPAD